MKERLQVEEKLKYEIEKLKQQNGQNYTSSVGGSVINNSFVNNINKGKNNQSTNKRNCHSIDTRAFEKSNISVQKKVKQRKYLKQSFKYFSNVKAQLAQSNPDMSYSFFISLIPPNVLIPFQIYLLHAHLQESKIFLCHTFVT